MLSKHTLHKGEVAQWAFTAATTSVAFIVDFLKIANEILKTNIPFFVLLLGMKSLCLNQPLNEHLEFNVKLCFVSPLGHLCIIHI